MESILYHVTNGANNGFNRQAVLSHNLANHNTPGFKADLFTAQSVYMQGPGLDSSAFAVEMRHGHDLTAGTLITTGRDLDVAVEGNGWLAVQDASGQEAYTQAGNFEITANGQLVTGSGRPVIGDGGPISIPPAQRIEIGSDGTVSIVPLDADPDTLAVIDRLKLVKLDPKNIEKTDDGFFRPMGGGVIEADASIRVVKGALMSSNVNAIDQMVNMIEANRDYERNMKLMQSVDENQKRLAQLLQD
ncbi:MAG: flagellar basal-body rod protein FlgF [Legionellaceae bacterium]|nr:flagellar basal-body rod protein FlgF [Legionellaceae bacterium]